jgi:hypothetical protein
MTLPGKGKLRFGGVHHRGLTAPGMVMEYVKAAKIGFFGKVGLFFYGTDAHLPLYLIFK